MMKDKNCKVLLVEDNPGCSSAIKLLLERKEYIVSSAYNGLDAIIMAANEKFDLILIDYQMPLMDGIKAAKSIREIDKDVLILSISLLMNAMFAE